MRWIIVLLASLLLAGCTPRECLRYEEYEYYDSMGTSLWITTKNPGMLALNGYKTGTRCVEYKEQK